MRAAHGAWLEGLKSPRATLECGVTVEVNPSPSTLNPYVLLVCFCVTYKNNYIV